MRYQLAVPVVMLALAVLLIAVHAGTIDVRLALMTTGGCIIVMGIIRARRLR